MHRPLLILIGFFSISRISAQIELNIESINDRSIYATYNGFDMFETVDEIGRRVYTYQIIRLYDPNQFYNHLFEGELKVNLEPNDEYFDTSNVMINGQNVELHISNYIDYITFHIYTKERDFDTVRFSKKILQAEEASIDPEAWVNLSQLGSVTILPGNMELEMNIPSFMEYMGYHYPKPYYSNETAYLYGRTDGSGYLKIVTELGTEDGSADFGFDAMFPVLTVNGNVYPYVANVDYYAEKYFDRQIYTARDSNLSRIKLINNDQHLYLYDLGYEQSIVGMDKISSGQYYLVEFGDDGEVKTKYDLGTIIPEEVNTNEDYNLDGKQDVIFTQSMDDLKGRTFIYKAGDDWKEVYISFNQDLNNQYYYEYTDQQAEDNDQAYYYGFDDLVDTNLVNWKSVIFHHGYSEHKDIIHVSVKKKDVTDKKELSRPNPKRKYQTDYYVENLIDKTMNYSGTNAKKGEKAIRKGLATIEYYRANPAQLLTDVKN
jgi:hypothetical protein